MADQRTSSTPFYSAQGLAVVKRPVVNASGGTTTGFTVCHVNEYIDGAAETIADALNRLPEAEAMLVKAASALRGNDEVEVNLIADQIEDWMCGNGR